jgi:hypothetical protein
MNDARTRQEDAGARPTAPSIDDALAAVRAGDVDRLSDWLHDARFASSATGVVALRTVAETIVAEQLDVGFAPSATVDEITVVLAGRCGLSLDEGSAVADVVRGQSRADAADASTDVSVARQLTAARAEIERLRAERDALEARLDELAGARVLADELAAELERDEWLRARLRRLKDTRVARALIYARRRVRTRTKSSANR